MATLKSLIAEEKLIHSKMKKVVSHVQRQTEDWIQNTILIDGYEVPFKYKRKKMYKSLKGARVDIAYYPSSELLAGIEFEMMKVVKLAIS
ncbi:MAG: hypothetical protein COA83_08915 [Methylophaga sp.]|nr:MAG: hypothetical protein COA83_08915 [Methylophaga sp.]